jgi:hypothetical protein
MRKREVCNIEPKTWNLKHRTRNLKHGTRNSQPGTRNAEPATLWLLLLLVAVVMVSCKTPRTVIKAPLKEEGPDYLIGKLDESELQFNWMSAKFSASYALDRKVTEFSGQIRIRKDSVVWVSITPAMGIEMIRLKITTDSVMFMNRFSKTFFIGDYSVVNEFLQTNLNFDILQAFIIGNDFQFYDNASFRASIDNMQYKLSTTGRRKIKKEAASSDTGPLVLVQNIWLDPESYKISRVDVKEYQKDNRKFEANYSEFIEMDKQLIPTLINVNVTSEHLQEIMISYSKIVLNEAFNFPYSVPDKYQQITKKAPEQRQ